MIDEEEYNEQEQTPVEPKQLLEGFTTEEAIRRCGELQIEKANIPLLLADRLNSTTQLQLLQNLMNEKSEEAIWYAEGFAYGELKMQSSLEAMVDNPKAKDAYKNISSERRRVAINKSLHKNFGIGEDVED